jgi:hypothetical protein
MLATDNWHKKSSYLNSVILGIILALMTLIRPTEILAFIIPLVWGVSSIADFKVRIKSLFKEHRWKTLSICVSFVIVCLPQLI